MPYTPLVPKGSAPPLAPYSPGAKAGNVVYVSGTLAIEKWESVDALKAHAAAPHMAAYGAKTRELIASRVIHILTPT